MKLTLNIHVVAIKEPRLYYEAYCDEFQRSIVGYGDTPKEALSQFFSMLSDFPEDVLTHFSEGTHHEHNTQRNP